ncbi:MAG: hypothetical protein WCT04_13215 [Planctomycetota bacterium]
MSIETDMSSTGSRSKPKQPTIRDHVIALADNGDMNGVVDALASDVGIVFDDKEKAELIRASINAHTSQRGTAGLIDAVLAQALSFDAELLLCCQARIRSDMKHDAKRRGYLMGPSENLIEEDLPRLARLEDRVIMLSKTIATVKHTLAIREAPIAKPAARGKIIRMDSVQRGVANE